MGADASEQSVQVLDPGAHERAAGPRRALVLTLAVISTALILGGLTWAWQWRTHPETFPGDGNEMRTTLEGPRRSLYFGVTYPYPGEGEAISIESVSPRTVLNTAEATFGFYVCTLDLDGTGYSALGATGPREFARVCPTPVPVIDGTELDVGAEPPQQLVMGVTVHRPGVVRTRGVDLTYSRGWQHGTQAIGGHVRITSR